MQIFSTCFQLIYIPNKLFRIHLYFEKIAATFNFASILPQNSGSFTSYYFQCVFNFPNLNLNFFKNNTCKHLFFMLKWVFFGLFKKMERQPSVFLRRSLKYFLWFCFGIVSVLIAKRAFWEAFVSSAKSETLG